MRTLIGSGLAAIVASLALVPACGSDRPESMVSSGGTSPSGATTSTGASSGTGGPSLGGSLSGGGSNMMNSGGDGTTSFGGDDGTVACAAATAETTLAPVYLVFLLDESGSMGDGKYGDRKEKWDPVTSALEAFFADADSAGITASLGVFPLNNTTTGPATTTIPADCDANVYGTPEVAPRALPDAETFAAAIAKLDPPNEYGTPTYPALTGTIAYAETLLKADMSRKVAIVMVTDGEPVDCADNTIDNTAKAAMGVADHIPTYVIGVGDSLASLNAIAEGGGTDKAFIVSLDNPTQTRKDLLDAINLIRGKSISCELKIPPPPAGKRLDPNKVNVEFTGTDMAKTALKYGATCTGDTAWHYDDPANPKTVVLCDTACATVKADAMGKLDLEFACENRQIVQ